MFKKLLSALTRVNETAQDVSEKSAEFARELEDVAKQVERVTTVDAASLPVAQYIDTVVIKWAHDRSAGFKEHVSEFALSKGATAEEARVISQFVTRQVQTELRLAVEGVFDSIKGVE